MMEHSHCLPKVPDSFFQMRNKMLVATGVLFSTGHRLALVSIL